MSLRAFWCPPGRAQGAELREHDFEAHAPLEQTALGLDLLLVGSPKRSQASSNRWGSCTHVGKLPWTSRPREKPEPMNKASVLEQ